VAAVEEIPLSQLLAEAGAYSRRTPLEGTLETTFRCNLSCVHCYVNEPAADLRARASCRSSASSVSWRRSRPKAASISC
jgi:hypothetical protein